jgi:carbon monoxide dehydrogenase subunit G
MTNGRRLIFSVACDIVVDRECADVWRWLIDFPRVPLWERGVLAVRQTSPGPAAVGTTLLVRRAYAGIATQVECRITEWQEQRSVTMALRGGQLRRATVQYAVEPASGQRTRVIYTGVGELRPALRFLTPFMPALGRAEERRNLATLKRMLEAPGRAVANA